MRIVRFYDADLTHIATRVCDAGDEDKVIAVGFGEIKGADSASVKVYFKGSKGYYVDGEYIKSVEKN